MLNKEQILSAQDIEKKEVPVPEWGGSVMVYGLTLAEKDIWNSSVMANGKASMTGATASLCSLCIRNEDGSRMFTDDDVDALGSKSAIALNRVFQVAQKLSGIGLDEVEETVKNSEAIQIEGSD
jgi:hypothetical protein